jgi:hypothetical protein
MQHPDLFLQNIRMKHLLRTYGTSETLEIYAYNMSFSPFFFGKQSVPASQRPRMVARPYSGQLCLRLA